MGLGSTRKGILTRFFIVLLFGILSVAGIIFSLYLFYVSKTLYMYLLATFFTLLSLVAGLFNIYASIWYFRSYFYDSFLQRIKKGLKKMERYPTVAIAVPVYNEDPHMVGENLSELTRMRYPKDRMRFYLLDDSTDPRIERELVDLSRRYGAVYIHREDRKGFKAG